MRAELEGRGGGSGGGGGAGGGGRDSPVCVEMTKSNH